MGGELMKSRLGPARVVVTEGGGGRGRLLVHMLRLQARVQFSEAVASVLRSMMMMMMMMGKCIA